MRSRRKILSIGIIALFSAIAAASIIRSKEYFRKTDPAILKKEKANTPAGMVYIPGGDALIGSSDPDADDDVKPIHKEFVPSFYIDRTEVTNSEYKKFNSNYQFPLAESNLPATNITFEEASAYAKWAGKRLPNELEWEKAARGTDGRKYPWGNNWNPGLVAQRANRNLFSVGHIEIGATKSEQCSAGPSRVQPVGSLPAGSSPYGCLDMAGNAWEWVTGYYNGNRDQRVLRGGAVGYTERSMRTYNRAIEGSGDT